MGYCEYRHCSDPNCIGGPRSGPYPAIIGVISVPRAFYNFPERYPGDPPRTETLEEKEIRAKEWAKTQNPKI